jgi:hypothetical protein
LRSSDADGVRGNWDCSIALARDCGQSFDLSELPTIASGICGEAMRYHRPFDNETEDDARFRDLFRSANFDPTGGLLTGGLALAGGGISALGTLAGGQNAATLGKMRQAASEFTATQDTMNAPAAIAGAQRRAIDIGQRTNLAASSSRAIAASGGVTAGTGSAATNEAQITARGRYASALALFQGQNEATADLNKATAAHYQGALDLAGGEMAKTGSEFAAAGTIANAGASAFRMYGMQGGGGYPTGYGGPFV